MALQQHIFRPGVSLDHLLANRRWIRREVPFPHLVATNVFTQPFYNLLAQEFYREFEREAPEGLQDPALRMNGYDAYGLHFPPGIEGPLSIFLSRPWHDLLGSLFRVNASCAAARPLPLYRRHPPRTGRVSHRDGAFGNNDVLSREPGLGTGSRWRNRPLPVFERRRTFTGRHGTPYQ